MLSIRFVSKVKSTLKALSNHVVITVNTMIVINNIVDSELGHTHGYVVSLIASYYI